MSDHDYPVYKSMRDLHMSGVSIPVLATAIEKHGIYAWDRYNRFRKVSADDPLAARALDVLADQVQDAVSYPARDRPDAGPLNNPWCESGWPDHDCPDFAALAAGLVVRTGGDDAPSSSALLLIEALRALLVGEPLAGGPRFRSNSQLMEHILAKYDNVRGLSSRTLDARFAEARKLMEIRLKEK